jgi:hypothetical protein
MSRFFNPGFAWNDTLKYDNPVGDAREINLISYYRVEAPQKDFFEVKDTTMMRLPTGEEYDVPLRFKELIRQQYAERGVILVVAGRVCTEEENIAGSDDEAKKKGNAMWRHFLREKANEWVRIVEETKATGQLPRPATGLFKRVLEEIGMQDPADTAMGFERAKEGQKANQDLQSMIQSLRDEVNQLKGAQSARKTA